MTTPATISLRYTSNPIVYRLALDNTEAVFEFDFEGTVARTLADFPRYAVTEDGRCLSLKKHGLLVLKHGTSAAGCYCYVNIGRPPFKVSQLLHILVARAYIANPKGKPQVNHKDGNPGNNAASNLEWVTQSENVRHANELRKQQGRSRFQATLEQRSQVARLHRGGMSIADAAKLLELPYEVARSTIRAAKRRLSNPA